MATAVKKAVALKRSTKAVTKPKAPRVTGTARKKSTPTIGEQAPLKLERPVWTTACPDWQSRIVNGETLTPCKPLFPTAAKAGMDIFNRLQMVDCGLSFGDGNLPWIKEFAEAIFGAYCDIPGHPDEGRRLINTFFLLIPKKNNKSTTAAGIMLTAILLNWREEAEFIILSPTKEVADNSWKPLRAAILADEQLSAMFTIRNAERTAIHNETNATLKVVAADDATVTGKKATGVLVDELHEFGTVAKAENMLVEATGGLMARPEGFVIYLSTQSASTPAGVFKKKMQYARKVRDGVIHDPTFLSVIYEYPDEYLDPITKPYMRPENWPIVNPNWGVTIDAEKLTQKINEAKEGGEDSIQSVVSKHLNIQIGLDLGADRWPGADLWLEAANDPVEAVPQLGQDSFGVFLSQCEVVAAGADGGGLDDLLGLSFTGRVKGTTDRFLTWSHAWGTDIVLERRKEIAPRLKDFEREGCLTIYPTLGLDVKEAAIYVKRAYDSGLLVGVGIDPARIASFKTALADVGLPVEDDKWLIKVRQGWSMASVIWWVERALAEGRFKHSSQGVVNWGVGNAKVIPRGNALLVTKEVSGKAKIDVVMSMFNSSELMSYNPASRTGGYSLDSLTLMG